MDILYYIGIPAIVIGSAIYVKNTTITKQDCISFSLQSIDKIHTTYIGIEKDIINIIDNYTKNHYKDLEIITKDTYVPGITKLEYSYNDQLFSIIYDTVYPLEKIFNIGDHVYADSIFVSKESKNISFIEFVHTTTNDTTIIENNINKYIVSVAGPNQDFYNREEQPIYIPTDIINKDILEQIENYHILITYMNLKQIQKKIIII